MNIKILLTGSAIALGASFSAAPVSAQATCELSTAGPGDGGATATGSQSLACGQVANTGGANDATAIGFAATTTGNYSVAIGHATGSAATSTDTYTIAVGSWAESSSTLGGVQTVNSLVSVFAPTTGGFGSVVVGTGTIQAGTDNVQVGNFSNTGSSAALVTAATALGTHTTTSANNAVTIGAYSTVTAAGGTAIGFSADAIAAGAIAIGQNAQGNGLNSVAIGNGATNATFTNAVALGNGSTNTANNQVFVGGRTIGGVANGIAATDAVNVSQLNTAIAGSSAALAAIDGRVNSLEALAVDFDSRLNRLDRRISAAGAVSSALSGAAFLPGKRFNLTGNVATYDGAYAGAILLGTTISENIAFTAGVSHGFNKGGKTAARAGLTFGW